MVSNFILEKFFLKCLNPFMCDTEVVVVWQLKEQ